MKFARLTFGLLVTVLLMTTNGFAQKAPTVDSEAEADVPTQTSTSEDVGVDLLTALEKNIAKKAYVEVMEALVGTTTPEVEMMSIEEAARIEGVDPEELRRMSIHLCGKRNCLWIRIGKKDELATIETASLEEAADMEGVNPDELKRLSIHFCGKRNCLWIGSGPRGNAPTR